MSNETPDNVKNLKATINDADVLDIDEGDEVIPPLRFRIPECDTVFTAYEPDAGTVMDIESASDTRTVLGLFLGDEWPAVEDALSSRKPEALVDLATKLSRHFKLSGNAVVANRQARRRAARGKGR